MEGSERKRYNRQNKKRKVMTKEKVRSKILGLSDSFVKLYYDGRVGKREKCNMQDKRKEKKRDKTNLKLNFSGHNTSCFFLFFLTPDSGYKQNQKETGQEVSYRGKDCSLQSVPAHSPGSASDSVYIDSVYLSFILAEKRRAGIQEVANRAFDQG